MTGWGGGALPILVLAVGVLSGCVRAGQGDPVAERTYVAAVRAPADALTAAATAANDTCAGGSQPDPGTCYTDTQKEIGAAQALQTAMRGVPTPARFAKANSDLLKGLDVMVQGLTQRNQGLAGHSSSQYGAGNDMVNQSLQLQKTALAEYPSGSGITA